MKKLFIISALITSISLYATDNPPSKDIETIHQLIRKNFPNSKTTDFFKIDPDAGTMVQLSENQLQGKYITLEKINLRDPQVGYTGSAVAAIAGVSLVGGVVAGIVIASIAK